MVRGVKVVWRLATHIPVYMCAHAHSVDIGKVSSLMPEPIAPPT